MMFAAELRQLRATGFYQGLHIVTFGRLYKRPASVGWRSIPDDKLRQYGHPASTTSGTAALIGAGRKNQTHDYRWVLRDYACVYGQAPRHFRKLFKRSQRMEHRLEIAHWLKDTDHPVQCDPRTRHSATWAWW